MEAIHQPRFQLHENSLLNHEDARESGIRIIAAKQPVEDLMLCSYVKQRNLPKNIPDKYCYDVHYIAGEKEKTYEALGFKNSAGGFKL